MNAVILLDSGPLGLLMQRRGLPVAEACRTWLANHVKLGVKLNKL